MQCAKAGCQLHCGDDHYCAVHQEEYECSVRSAVPVAEVVKSYDASIGMQRRLEESMSQKYPKYYKDVSQLKEVDVYAIHQLFNIQDPSGAIQHASKKLLLSGVRTGGKTQYQDIQEARDTLTRYLELNKPD